jgi:uncharacterized protein with HEPN domain
MLIGEVTTRLSDDFCTQHPSIPWHEIAGMRNRLVRHNGNINWPLVWITASQDAPQLLEKLVSLVAKSPSNSA